MPRQNSTFDAGGILVDASENGKFADVPGGFASGNKIVDSFEHLLGLSPRLAFDIFCEQGGGGLGDATARTYKAGVLYHSASER
jgi:hypothetical protein